MNGWQSQYLLRQLGLHLLLEPTQQEGAEHLVETADDQDGLLLVQVHLVGGRGKGREVRGRSQQCYEELRLGAAQTPDNGYSLG